jgi:hypothetical protein
MARKKLPDVYLLVTDMVEWLNVQVYREDMGTTYSNSYRRMLRELASWRNKVHAGEFDEEVPPDQALQLWSDDLISLKEWDALAAKVKVTARKRDLVPYAWEDAETARQVATLAKRPVVKPVAVTV